MASQNRRTLGPYIGTSLAWGSTFSLIKIGLNAYGPGVVGFGRCFVGALVLAIVARFQKLVLPRARTTLFHLWVVGLFASVIPGILLPIIELRTSSAFTGITAGLIPLSTLLFLVTIFREEAVHRHEIVGLGIGFIGLLVLLGVWRGLGPLSFGTVLLLGVVIASYGAAFPYIKRHISPLHLNPIALACTQQSLSAATLTPFLLWPAHNHHDPVGAVVAIIALGVFAGGFAYMWNFMTVRVWGSSTASTVEYTAALVAALVGVTLLHEHLTWNEPVGGVVVILGALIGWGQLNSFTIRLRKSM
jgi:drug/metabolite transporter (DMT)-like permease